MLTFKDFNEKCPEIDISEGIFNSIARRIRTRINFLTFERISDDDIKLQNKVDNLIADIICEIYLNGLGFQDEKAGEDLSPSIKSESVGEYKVEYVISENISSDKKSMLMDKLIDDRIREAFIHTGLMFRGFYENERQCNDY